MDHQKLIPLALASLLGACEAASQAQPPVSEPSSKAPTPISAPHAAAVPNDADQLARADHEAAKSLCEPNELVVFSCTLENRKLVSLCSGSDAVAGAGRLYYTYGTPDRPGMVFPPDRSAANRFKRTPLGFAGSAGGYAYSFENGEYRYIVYSISGAKRLEDQGVIVTKGDSRKPRMAERCSPGSTIKTDNEALLDWTLTWARDADIERHGLPSKD